ncbi:outer membrane protein [Paracoccus jeotgali]|uniref:Porin family protein n=1 Tax=Paracoccus jeotgali TaxID=2065379 RepID=A0A2K9MHE4_9RHOB|nr:outer membrane beta-barrel protein [Paracoccus jeotgali]AUM74912.1 porin family protein [Paracoccus jeotgali]
MMSSGFISRLAGAAAFLAAPAAFAGGFVAPTVEVVDPIVPVIAQDWTGAYVGASIGYAFAGDDRVGYAENNDVFATPGKLELSGANAGLRVGYRKQFTGQTREWVMGAELGYEGGSIEDSFSTAEYEAGNEINSVLALRVKTGVLNAPQDTLFYGILGVARADYDYRASSTDGVIDLVGDGEKSTGYIVGFGVERKMTDKLSLTGEWEYANFGKTNLGDGVYSTEMTPDYHNIKLGLNYRF